jgi:hypothetical protein
MANQFDFGDTLSFEVTYDRPDLAYVAAKVYQLVNGSFTPSPIVTIPMLLIDAITNTYACFYRPNGTGIFVVTKGSYLDNTYLSGDGRPCGSEGFTVIFNNQTPGISSSDLVAVLDDNKLSASLDDNELVAILEE